jgi:hypothetical protein
VHKLNTLVTQHEQFPDDEFLLKMTNLSLSGNESESYEVKVTEIKDKKEIAKKTKE